MRFASVTQEGRPLAVAIEDERAIPLRGIAELGLQTPLSLLRDPPLHRAGALPVAELHLRPLVPRGAKIICVGLNYHAHVEETHRDLPDYPVLFTKFAPRSRARTTPSPALRNQPPSTTRASSWW